jgi:hypothetical protein
MQETTPKKYPLYDSLESLREENKTTKELVLAIGNFIVRHAKSLPEKYEAKSILESRFTPAEEAFEKGLLSCGAIANMSASVLRHLGFEVKLIYGESEDSVDHAWISVLEPESNEWVQYDLTRGDGVVLPTNVMKGETDSWESIKDKILEDHATYRERMEKRGL